jgi:outer membrane lipoprotein SlyB
MQANSPNLPAGHFSSKPLWAAITVLGVAVIALGASLIHVQTRPVDGHTVFAIPEAPSGSAPSQQASPDTPLPVTAVAVDEAVVLPKPAVDTATPAKRSTIAAPDTRPAATAAPGKRTAAPVATPPVAAAPAANYPPAITTAPAPYVITESGPIASQPMPQLAPAARAICADCGQVISVTPVQRKGDANGTGAVAGGVLGAVVGNQVGRGSGRAIATILGAVGGGFAGNAIEKNMQTVMVYLVQVRMDDGSVRTIEQASPLSVGSAVFVQGQTVRMADGAAGPLAGNRNGATPLPPLPGAKVYSTDRN